MEGIFIYFLNSSISAVWLILLICLVRSVFKKISGRMLCILWLLVWARLLLPMPQSILSIIPSANTVSIQMLTDLTPQINSGIDLIDRTVNPFVENSLSPTVYYSATPLQIAFSVAGFIWIIGVAVMLIYMTASYITIASRRKTAINYRENIWMCDGVTSPFTFGVLRPRIYLPSDIDTKNLDFVLCHERAHLKRYDHILKPLGFLILSIHWFNPVVWFSYILFCRDIERACDEFVIRDKDHTFKQEYSKALVQCSSLKNEPISVLLDFVQGPIKNRLSKILEFKKENTVSYVLFASVCVLALLCFMTNPTSISSPKKDSTEYTDYSYSDGIRRSDLSLDEETGRFTFMLSPLSSYIPTGSYTETSEEIILTTDDGGRVYTFKKLDGKIVFVASLSSDVPKYKYDPTSSQGVVCIPDGAIFSPLK